MTNEIIVDVQADETRVALLEDKELVEVFFEKTGSQRLVGSIFRGKVESVLPGMHAAFVDIGMEKNAFLFLGDVIPGKKFAEDECAEPVNPHNWNIEDLLKPGQEITVQVIKEAIGTKGCRVTTHITLPGRQLVLLPNDDYTGVSRRIEDEGERSKLKKIADNLKPPGMGLIVRTASVGQAEEEFALDISFLSKLWESILIKERKGQVPRCLHEDMDLVSRTVRDLFTSDISRFVVNDRQQYEKALDLAELISNKLKFKVELYQKDYEIFEFYQIESKIKHALFRKVWLKCGGYIVIDKTEALTVIDVNTGKYTGCSHLEDTVLKTNLEAASEIAKQIRLRDIGGIIIIDFIDMHEAANQQLVMEELKLALKRDRTKSTVVGMTGLGLIEMTRKKIKRELSSVMTMNCPHCEGTGRVQC